MLKWLLTFVLLASSAPTLAEANAEQKSDSSRQSCRAERVLDEKGRAVRDENGKVRYRTVCSQRKKGVSPLIIGAGTVVTVVAGVAVATGLTDASP